MSLSDKYYPRLQKDFFNKKSIDLIKDWTKINLTNNETDDYKKILCIIGPIGVGKTVTINNLFSGYNLIKLDSEIFRTNEKTTDTIKSLVHFKSKTLVDIDKWDSKRYKMKNNVLFIDNIELYDKSITNFIELLYNKYNVNIPLITITNNVKNKEYFNEFTDNTTFISFLKPTTNDLFKLIEKIDEFSSFNDCKIIKNKIVEKSENDIRQLFYILEQLNGSLKNNSNCDISSLIDEMESKITDIDLSEKMSCLITNNLINVEKRYIISTSEPQLITYSIYQNYLNVLDKYSKIQNDIDTASNIMDSISFSNTIFSCIYDEQNWELYDNFIMSGSVIPSKILNININTDINIINELNTFKDVSYNFSNSLNEVTEIHRNNNGHSHLIDKNHIFRNNELFTNDTFIIIKTVIYCINEINDFFYINKRGKNTTKKEKFKIYDLIEKDKKVKKMLDYVSDFIYFYKIFEIDINNILLNKNEYLDKEKRQQNINLVDIRIFKRLLNIFTFDNSNKLLKSHIETSIQYNIFTKVINNIPVNKVKEVDEIEKLITDIETIWNLK